jgi:hypothetical protein
VYLLYVVTDPFVSSDTDAFGIDHVKHESGLLVDQQCSIAMKLATREHQA